MTPELSERALILAPHGRDASVAALMLKDGGVTSTICATITQLVEELEAGAGFALMTEEALHGPDLRPVVAWIDRQAEWSDFPFILLTRRGGGPERNPGATRHLKTLGNVSFLERPFHPTTLISMSVAALRGRRRQYEARARLLELDERGSSLIDANETLERRVAERTGELEIAYQKAIKESAQRKVAEDQLRQAQKLETVGKLTGGVAHDFNNLLTAVLGNLSLLEKHVKAEDAKAQRLIEGAMQGAKRGASLTQRLLAFSRRQSLQMAPTDVVGLVSDMKDLVQRSIGPAIELSFELTHEPAVSLLDANQVELALLNLVVNARDAMPNGGALRIGVDHSDGAGASLVGKFVRLWVSDTGTGMDGPTLDRAIDPFFSTKEIGKGTGLGLSMVHGLAVQQSGAFRLSSVLGEGTRAELYLPATQDAAVPSVAPPSSVAANALALRILLVDDDALIALSSVDLLEDLGHKVFKASSGAQALQILRTTKNIDLVITDFAMPGMTGGQLIEAVLAQYPAMPILLATGYAELPEDQASTIPRVSKPYTQSDLATEIAKVIAGDKGLKANSA